MRRGIHGIQEILGFIEIPVTLGWIREWTQEHQVAWNLVASEKWMTESESTTAISNRKSRGDNR